MQAGMWLASQVCKHSSFHSSVWHGWCVTQICSSCLPKNCTQCELEFHPTVWDEVVLSTVEHEFHTCWGLDTSLEYEHQIPPETGDTNLASQCFYHSVGPEYLCYSLNASHHSVQCSYDRGQHTENYCSPSLKDKKDKGFLLQAKFTHIHTALYSVLQALF